MNVLSSLNGRIQFVDALRGVAALAVVLFHYGERIDWNNWGNMGVPMFFVLSGFVIAMSVGARPPVSLSFLGRFALRRAIRLDPPYWLSIAAIIVIGLVAARFGMDSKPTSLPQVLSHLVYLQGFIGHEQILVVYWTLCYEIQFYLALILLLWFGHSLRIAKPLMFGTLILSIIDRNFELDDAAFMGRFWFCFASGAMVYWAISGTWKVIWVVAALLLDGTFGVWHHDPYAITTFLTATVLFAVIAFGRANFGSSRPLQFLGKISYSLYLTHLIGGWIVMTIALRFMHEWAALAVGVIASIVSAWVFYVLVEKPATRLSKRVKVVGETAGVPGQVRESPS